MMSCALKKIRRSNPVYLLSLLAACFTSCVASAAPADVSRLPPPAGRQVGFVKDIQPILARSCYECHGPKKAEAGLRWDVKEIAMKGSEHGQVIIPGKSAGSLMVHL